MSCREKKEIKFSVVKEIIIQWGRKTCTVGRKDNAAKGRRGDTDRTCRGSVRTEIRQVFREGSSRKEPSGRFPKAVPKFHNFFSEVCSEPSQEIFQMFFLISWHAMQPSWVYILFHIHLSLWGSQIYTLPEMGFSSLRPRNQTKQGSLGRPMRDFKWLSYEGL